LKFLVGRFEHQSVDFEQAGEAGRSQAEDTKDFEVTDKVIDLKAFSDDAVDVEAEERDFFD
jgi:hypothetical protein